MRTTVVTTLILLAFTASADMLPGARVVNITPSPVLRGADATLGTVGLSGEYEHIRVQLTQLGRVMKPATESADGAFSDDASTIEFAVPRTLPLGTYKVALYVMPPVSPAETGTAPPAAPPKEREVAVAAKAGHLIITSDAPVEITAVHPAVSFPLRRQFEFRVVGSGFSPTAQDNLLEVDGVGRFHACEAPGVPERCVTVLASDDGRELAFSGLPRKELQGVRKIRVRVGQRASEPATVTLSRVAEWTPLVVALTSIVVLALVVWLMLRPVRAAAAVGRGWNPPWSIFIDAETNTYSLSKLQIYVWMAVAVFSYVYLIAAHTYVQGHETFPEFPDNLPGILLISVGTTALATGITAAKGTKGAGGLRPSTADFLTTGGVLAPDRLQFFGWTIVGALAFIALVLLREPATIKDLPTVPDGLLMLMGISSAGYLGGKLARKAGPVIKLITALYGSPLTIEIRGESLSPDATISIDATPLTRAHLDPEQHPDGRPAAEIDPGAEFAKVLRLTIPTPPPEWRQGAHTLTLVNPDAQRAVWPFEILSREAAARAIPIMRPLQLRRPPPPETPTNT